MLLESVKKVVIADTISTDASSRDVQSSLKSSPNPNKAKSDGLEPPKNQKNDEKPPKEVSLPDSILAEKIAETLKDFLIFDDVSTEWFCCCDGLWRPTTQTRAWKKIEETLHIFSPSGFSSYKLKCVESMLRLYLNLTEWQSNRRFLPMQNGMYDIETGVLTDYTPDSKFTWQLPYKFDKTAQLDNISKWLHEVCCGENETMNIIRAFMKLALTGSDVQKFLEVIGPGGSGKSTLIWLIRELIGEVNLAVSDLKNLEMNRFETAGLYRKKLAVINDASRYNGDVSVLKALTGGDPVRLERKNKQQGGSFVFDGVVMIVSNEAIQATDYTSGLARRRLPIYFNKKISDADKARWDKLGGVENVLKLELTGLLNWALTMPYKDFKAIAGSISGTLTKSQRNHLIDTNKIAAWVDDNLILQKDSRLFIGSVPKSETPSSEIQNRLYPDYHKWCSDNGVSAVSVSLFPPPRLADLCEHLKLPVKRLDRSNRGRSFEGFVIRDKTSSLHIKEKTPITEMLLEDDRDLNQRPQIEKQDNIYPISQA
jgi:putative DNA primase/helicase